MNEEYDLKWKTYTDHLVGTFRDLRTDEHFADVTLVSDDQIQIPAHKVVLSACSPVFKTLLVNNPHSHPLLYLRGIKQLELKAILKFMYLGETQIFESRMHDFVSVAKDLEIKEISSGQYENEDDEAVNTNEKILNYDKDVPFTEDPEVEKENKIFQEPENIDEKISNHDDKDKFFSEDPEIEAEKKIIPDCALTKPRQNIDGRFICDECEATFASSTKVTRHKQSIHEGMRYPCGDCDYQATDYSNLIKHRNSKHLGVKYPCPYCKYQATQKAHLKTHIARHA